METTNVNDKMLCKIEGCTNKRTKLTYKKYRGVCEKHRQEKRGRLSDYKNKHRSKVKGLSSTPCFKCGWDLSYTDRHRIAPGTKGGQYTLDNTKSICPNCHRVETYAQLAMSESEQDRRRVGNNYELCSVEECLNRVIPTEDRRFKQLCSIHRESASPSTLSTRVVAALRRKEFQKEMLNLLILAETKGLAAVKTQLQVLISDEEESGRRARSS